jgi:hypothetical protein
MARIGLRMMPTFQSPSLECRTVGFPQYGYKAGLSDRTFACNTESSVAWFASILRTLRCHRRVPRAVSRDAARLSTTLQAAYTALPQGPSLQPGFALQVFIAYLTPSAPLAISRRVVGHPSRRSPFSVLDITTTVTGLLCRWDSHPLD